MTGRQRGPSYGFEDIRRDHVSRRNIETLANEPDQPRRFAAEQASRVVASGCAVAFSVRQLAERRQAGGGGNFPDQGAP